MAIARAKAPVLVGSPKPRLAPPVPARTAVDDLVACATEIGIDFMPWQKTAGRYLMAQGAGERWLYREVAVVVARQNGKTRLLVPLIVARLRAGKRIMHTAQNRELPREVFSEVADIMVDKYRRELRSKPRFANGQEEIKTTNGGVYRIVAPTRGGARGPSNDLVIIDELREMVNFDFIGAAKPTLTASKSPQMLYLSNAGTSDSVVLNALQLRAANDPALAYLEWSAAPERTADDRLGWVESNPAIGHERGEMGPVLETLETEYRSASLEGTLAVFETEHLCRSVSTMRQKLVEESRWLLCKADLEAPRNASMAVSMSPDGSRASAAIAWMRDDLTVGLRVLYNVPGNPIETAELGKDLALTASKLGIKRIGYDPLTDGELAKYFKRPKPEPLSGQKFANATAQFVNTIHGGMLRWSDADAVTDDLTWTSRKHDSETGSYQAVRAQDDRPITASLAAIRAVYLASGPKPAVPKVM